MEYDADVYYVRNAPTHSVIRDRGATSVVPAHVISPAQHAAYARPRVPAGASQMVSPWNIGPMPPHVAGYPTGYPTVYAQYPYAPSPLGNIGTLVNGFGGFGQLVDIAAQVLAAVMPMPAAPEAQGTGDNDSVTTDTWKNSKNLITYQSALASYAKRDEQIRTIGSLVKKLVS